MGEEFLTWFFDGLGSQIIAAIIGGIVGAFLGYRAGLKNGVKQTQTAGANTKQEQKVEIINNSSNNKNQNYKADNRINQRQESGENSTQSQVGRIINGDK